MGAEVGNLPGLGACSHLGGSAFEATAHAAGHGAVHDAFMTLPPYTRTSEGKVHEPGLGVRNGSIELNPIGERYMNKDSNSFLAASI